MFIKIEDIIINTDNITTIATLETENEDYNSSKNGIHINMVNKNRVTLEKTSMNQIEYFLGKVNEKENKETRFEIMDL